MEGSCKKQKVQAEMASSGCVFSLPMEIESENFMSSEEDTLLTVDSDGQKIVKTVKFQGRVERQNAPVQRKTVCSLVISTLKMIQWHVLIFTVITCSLYAAFHFCLSKKAKTEVLKALVLFDDWRQLVFFFGIYLSYSVKKVGDVSSVRL